MEHRECFAALCLEHNHTYADFWIRLVHRPMIRAIDQTINNLADSLYLIHNSLHLSLHFTSYGGYGIFISNLQANCGTYCRYNNGIVFFIYDYIAR